MATNLGRVGPRPDSNEPAPDYGVDDPGIDSGLPEDGGLDGELQAMEAVCIDLDMAVRRQMSMEQYNDLSRHADALRGWLAAGEGDEGFERGRAYLALTAVLADESALATGGVGLGDNDLRREVNLRVADDDDLEGVSVGDDQDPTVRAAVRALSRRCRFDLPVVRDRLLEGAFRFGEERQLSKFAASMEGA